MKWPQPRIVAILAVALVILSVAWISLAGRVPEIAREHGPMENLQTGCLLAGIVLLIASARAANETTARLIGLGAALFYFTLLLLEFDVRPFKIPFLTLLLNGAVRNAFVGVLWLWLLHALFKHRTRALPAIRGWLASPPGVLLMAAGFFWVAGRGAEELHLFSGKHLNIFAEELMENHAAIIMLVAACEAFRLRRALNRGVVNSIDAPGGSPEGSAKEKQIYGTHET